MANRGFEMYEIRQIIARLRLGESDRGIARTQRTGRATVASIRRVADERGWLDPAGLLPEDGLLAAAFKSPRTTAQNVSSVAPFRESILAWHAQSIQVSTMAPVGLGLLAAVLCVRRNRDDANAAFCEFTELRLEILQLRLAIGQGSPR